MENPKHKIFFGAPDGRVPIDKNLPVLTGEIPTGLPCWTWDTEQTVFSSASLTFDCDFDLIILLQRQLSSAFTWDMNTVSLDTIDKIYT